MEAYEQCCRFEKCNVNVCPLHPNYKKYTSDDSDTEQKCTLAKNLRKRLGINLSWKGMTEREISGAKRWDSLPESVKQEKIAKLKERSLITRLSAKGYAMIPKSKGNPQNTYTTELRTLNSMGEKKLSTDNTQNKSGDTHEPN